MDLDLTGKHALVCGGSQGRGHVTAEIGSARRRREEVELRR